MFKIKNIYHTWNYALPFSIQSRLNVVNKVKGPGVDKEVTATSIRAGIHKIFIRIASSENPDQTASSEAV